MGKTLRTCHALQCVQQDLTHLCRVQPDYAWAHPCNLFCKARNWPFSHFTNTMSPSLSSVRTPYY